MSGIDKYKLVGLDTNIFIYHFEGNPKFIKYTNLVFEALAKQRIHGVTSIISLSETLSYPMPNDIVKEIEEGFKSIPNLTILDLDYKIALEAAKMRRKYPSLKLPDAIQLATTILARAQILITNDKRIKAFKELPIILLPELDN